MARIIPSLRADVYLASTSQDQFTLFPLLFAWAIRSFGLLNAAVALFALCSVALYSAAWTLIRELWDGRTAWFSLVMLVVAVAGYGAYGVFQCAENYLTARSMAEALVVASLALRMRQNVKLSWAIATLAMFIHPLMALPGLLLLFCLSVSLPLSLATAAAGIVLALALEGLATAVGFTSGELSIMDGQWLEVVRERSQFLFLRYWKLSDWEMHVRTLLSLAITVASADDARVRRLCMAAAVVGVTGLAIALIACSLGPIPILLQGQAWRWFWVTGVVAVLTVMPTALRLWKDGGCGSVSATLLVAGWTFSPTNGTGLLAVAFCLWQLRGRVHSPTQNVLRLLSFLLIAAIISWTVANVCSVCFGPVGTTGGESFLMEKLRSVYALPTAALAVYGLLWGILHTDRPAYVNAAIGALLLTLCVFAMKGSFSQRSTVGTAAEVEAFSDWRAVIPATSNVLLVPTGNSAGFVWFSLQRPSYISVSQAAGVVFSPVTSQEIRRRSQVLLPIMEPNWKLLSQNTFVAQGGKLADQTHPLTAPRLIEICADRQLGFVIAKEFVGFDARTHALPGEWKGWNLYDCRRVRQSDSSA